MLGRRGEGENEEDIISGNDVFALFFNVSIFSITANAVPISIDGDLTDWESINPIVVDTIGDPGYYVDIASACVANDTENLFFRVDYANNTPPWGLWLNVTLRTNNGSLYLVIAAAAAQESFVHLTSATSLTEDCMGTYPPTLAIDYDDRAAISSDSKSLEFSVPLADLGDPTSIDIVFWTDRPTSTQYDKAPDTGFVTYNLSPHSRIWIVDDDGPGDFSTIQEAVNASNSGDTILVRAGTYHENVVVSKPVSLIGESRETTIIDGNGGDVFYVAGDNVTVSDFTIQSGTGIRVYGGDNFVSNCIIKKNRIINNLDGISITCGGALSSTICDNDVANNTRGISFLEVANHASLVIGNNITNNEYGICVYTLGRCNGTIYHNNFIDNTCSYVNWGIGVVLNNTWDNGYPSGGNYWSTYTGVDSFSGPYQNETGSDGIGDTQFVITGRPEEVDHYPLMTPFGAAWADLRSNVTITSSIPGDGFVKVDGEPITTPKTFLWDLDSTHTLEAMSLMGGINGSRYAWTNWSNDGPQTQNYTVTVTTILTANFKTQYFLDVTSAYDSPTPQSGWYDSGSAVYASVNTPCNQSESTRFKCLGWWGIGSIPETGTANNVSFVITQPSEIHWLWEGDYYIQVSSAHGTPTESSWIGQGGNFTVSVSSPTEVVEGSTQWICTGFSVDHGPYEEGTNVIFNNVTQPHNVTFAWKQQFWIEVSSAHDAATPSHWVDEDSSLLIEVSSPTDYDGEGTRFRCTGYTLDYNQTVMGETNCTLENIQSSHVIAFNWIRQNQLNVTTEPSNVLDLAPELLDYAGWYDFGDTVHLNSINVSQYLFDHWALDFNTSSGSSLDVLMDVPHQVTLFYFFDPNPPATNLTVGEPKLIRSGVTYVTPETPIILTANDAEGSGVASTSYRVFNSTYDTDWQIYSAPFYFTNLGDGNYSIEYRSIDSAGNIEATQIAQVNLISWTYVFTDTNGRSTTLKINTEHKLFQFITPNKDYGIRKATYMNVPNRAVIISHKDSVLKLDTLSIDTRIDFCVAYTKDIQTHNDYWVFDKLGTEK